MNVGVVSYGAGATLFLILTLLLLTAWRGRLQGGLLVWAAAVSCIWCLAVGYREETGNLAVRYLELLELLRDSAWFLFLMHALGFARRAPDSKPTVPVWVAFTVVTMCVVVAALIIWAPDESSVTAIESSLRIRILGFLLLAITGLALVEQLFRNTLPEHRWAIKYLCLGVGGLFAYDLFLYSNAMLFKHVDPELWRARGVVNAIVVPLIAVATARNPQWSVELFVSRHVVLYSATLLVAGIYLLLMAAVGYYIRIYGSTWGAVAQITFLFGAVVVLILLMFSGQLRARIKVFLGKHFYKNRYDYREEWLRFTHTLSTSEEDVELRGNAIRAIAEIVESPGGVMWVRQEHGVFRALANWQSPRPTGSDVRDDSPLVRFLESEGWIVYIDEFRRHPDRYPGLELPHWLQASEAAWLVAPMLQREQLVGFVVVNRSSTKKNLNWEDNDLLKTVGRQAASYVALLQATEALTDARQFDAFNRLSSYVVHDLKNMVAQLSLVVSNAKKHMHNPEFMEDAISTVDNASRRMSRLLEQLRKGRLEETTSQLVNMELIFRKVVTACGVRQPMPELICEGKALLVTADPDRIASVMEHIVQNAQEATPPSGKVTVRLYKEADRVCIEIEDTGRGMDEEFISKRLFRPFDTTKGNAGMGIGVYEARDFVLGRGGDIEVESEPGVGTRFLIKLPLAGSIGSVASPNVDMEAVT